MATPFVSTAVDETEDNVSTAATTLHRIVVHNPGAAIAYLKLWNGVAAGITPASDAADILIGMPATSSLDVDLEGVRFPAGCCIGATVEPGVGATAPASDFVVTLFYDD